MKEQLREERTFLLDGLADLAVPCEIPDSVFLITLLAGVSTVLGVQQAHQEREHLIGEMGDQRGDPLHNVASGDPVARRIGGVLDTAIDEEGSVPKPDCLPEEHEVPRPGGEAVGPELLVADVGVGLHPGDDLELLDFRVPGLVVA